MTNFLHDIAVPFKAFDGAVTFWMIPFTNPEAAVYENELERVHPSAVWRHKETGEETTRNPYPGDSSDPIVKAQREQGEWEMISLWHNPEQLFLICVPLTADIEFKGKKLPAEVRALQVFWEQRNGKVSHNWDLYRQLVSQPVSLVWFDAYNQTRDTSMDGPDELQAEPAEGADPNS